MMILDVLAGVTPFFTMKQVLRWRPAKAVLIGQFGA
jgi:hypothetical protein